MPSPSAESAPVRTKIVATLGPATADREVLSALMRAGMSVARLNFSHGTREEQRALIESVRETARQEGRVVAIIQDLQGPRLRIGEVSENVILVEGTRFVLDEDEAPGDANRCGIAYAHYLAATVSVDERILIDDGRIELCVKAAEGGRILTEVVDGGPLSSRKGVNLPDSALSIMSPTEKDLDDVRFGIEQGVDYIALSFVSDAAQVKALRAFIGAEGGEGGDVPIIAKIERQEAVENIEQIIECSDGVMVARGDLALEIGASRVPVEQKRIIRLANEAGKPVITATQMLDSMIREANPTRAETSDVANAIYDGSDAVMLSGETAIGRYPVRSVKVMADIARATEQDLAYDDLGRRGETWARRSIDAAICSAAVDIANRAGAVAIIAATSTGLTPRAVAVHRPRITLIAATTVERTWRRMALVWGVVPLLVDEYRDTDEMVRVVVEAARHHGLIAEGERVVITSGQPIGRRGSTNMVQVRHVGDWRNGVHDGLAVNEIADIGRPARGVKALDHEPREPSTPEA
jgi:pyruvate kinase